MTRAPKPPAPTKPPRRRPPHEPSRAGASDSQRDTRGTRRLGNEGEWLAGRFLTERGYRIVARNVRADRVEIDLVARRGPLLIFVEVKSRRSERHGSAAEAVDARKQQRLRRGAAAWLAARPAEARGARRIRMDVVLCRPGRPADVPGEPEGRGVDPPTPAAGPDAAWIRGEDGTPWRVEHWRAAF